jgi:hypothetical protein
MASRLVVGGARVTAGGAAALLLALGYGQALGETTDKSDSCYELFCSLAGGSGGSSCSGVDDYEGGCSEANVQRRQGERVVADPGCRSIKTFDGVDGARAWRYQTVQEWRWLELDGDRYDEWMVREYERPALCELGDR